LSSPAVQSVRRQFSWLWSRESLLRLALSLVLATALWLYVTGKENPTSIDFAQPIQINPTSLNKDLIVTSPPSFVRVSYHPSNPNLFPTANTFTATINLLNAHPGRQTVPVNVSADPGFQVTRSTPSHVTVVVERNTSRRVDVAVRYLPGHRTPAEGYYALPAQVIPNVVTVSGPESEVNQVKDVSVTQTLTGATSTISTSTKPQPEDSSGNEIPASAGLTVEPSPVIVTIPIKPIGGLKTVPVLVTTVGTPKSGYGVTGVSVDPPTITLSGPPTRLNRIPSVSLPVNLSGRSGGTMRRRVPILVPRGVTASSRTATVVITLQAIAATSATQVAVRPVGLGPGLVAQVRPGSVLVTISGPSTALAAASRALGATVNVSGYGTGVYPFQPVVSVPNGFTLVGVEPQSVSVSIAFAPTR
jgi:YbbR domain-containing protein